MVAEARPDRSAVRKRRLVATAHAAIQIVLSLWLLVQVNAWGFQQSLRVDCTRDRRFTVGDGAQRLLAQLDAAGDEVDVVITVRFDQTPEGSLARTLFGRAERICREFELANPRFHIADVVDVASDPRRFAELRETWGIEEENRIHLFLDGHREVLGADDLAEIRRPTPAEPAIALAIVSEHVDRALEGALERLLLRERQAVAFTHGNGELPLGNPRGNASIEALARALRERGYEVSSLDLFHTPEIPKGVRLLVAVAGIDRPFHWNAAARRSIEAYLDGGGSLLLFAPTEGACGLDTRLRELGIELGDGYVVVDGRDLQGARGPTNYLAITRFDDEHPITARFEFGEFRADLWRFRPLAVSGSARAILGTGADAWIEKDTRLLRRDPDDPRGPFPLVAAAEAPATGGGGRGARVVVFGSWSAALDDSFEQLPDTRRVILNCVSWLTDRETLASGGGRDLALDRIPLAEGLLHALLWTTVVLTPLLSVLAGLGVWWLRRSRR